ncbi:MAG: O-antigen translocase [Nonlabens sp.]
MRRLLHKLNKNLLLKVAGFNSVYVLIRIAIGAAMSKILAYYVGAAGMAVMGNLRNFTHGVWTFAVLGLENGLVKSAAQHRSSKEDLKRIFNTTWTLGLVVSIFIGVGCFVYASWLDFNLINREVSYEGVFKILGLSLPFHVIFVMLTGLFQGFEWYRKFITLNIIVSVLLFGISAYLAFSLNLEGALYSIVLVPFLQCVAALLFWKFSRAYSGIDLRTLFELNLDKKTVRYLLNFSVMALTSAVLIPLSYILIRKQVMFVVSDTAAGWWEAVSRVSNYYMMFVTSLISLYVLPSLSKDPSVKNYRSTITHFYKSILPIVVLGLLAVFICRELILQILFTEEFMGALPMFKWQLVGDFVKVVTSVMAFRFIAQNDLKKYLIAEVLSVASFVFFSYWLIPLYEEEGVVIAYLLNYVFYLFLLLILLRKELFVRNL